jgi:hypothetical protein
MNADLVQILDGLKGLPWPMIGQVGAFLGITLFVFWMLKSTTFVGRLGRSLEETVFTNWRLAVLGTTGIVLSLVAGYTTFDGLRNFTGGGMLSLLATIGIQGVMLVTAWLIGESFATGMNHRAAEGGGRRPADPIIGGFLGLVLVAIVFYWLLKSNDATIGWTGNSSAQLDRFSNIALYFALGVIVLAIIAFNRNSDLALPYVQSGRIIIKNAILWVMFLICMSTSVFFSFDSHFSGIFSAEERKRAADIRSVNQIAGTVADIGARIQTRQIDEAQRLFDTDAWLGYERQLDAVIKIANDSPRLIREQITRELEEQKSRIAGLEEKRANAQSGSAGLSTRKVSLSEELTRLSAERPEVTSQVQAQKAVVAEIEKRFDEQRAKTLAEEKGVEGSGKVGQGQFWRASKADEVKIQSELQVARERLRPAETRLIAIDRRLGTIKSEMAQIDGDLAKLRGESETAAQMISVAQSSKGTDAQNFDPASGVAGLERARQLFRQKPEQAALADIQNQCAVLASAAGRVKDLQDAAARIDCDPKQASEAASRVFALNQGLAIFSQNCAGGEKLPQTGGTDALLSFGRKCLQDSGLPSKDSAELSARMSALDLNRDDKAHRFVVTWNAFQDGNRLAYLALAIAITIDGLVFMSGLFGANAVRSPLSDVPSSKARSASQLEDIIDNALLPHSFDSARAVLGAMRPMTPHDGFTARIILDENDPQSADIKRVLTAAATIGAVRELSGREHAYEVRSELFEYLSTVSKRAFEASKEHANLAELERTVMVALMPADRMQANADTVLNYMHPIQESPTLLEKLGLQGPHGFMAEIIMTEVEDADKRTVRNALNAGATLNCVQRGDQHHYFVKGDFYKTLVRIRARLMSSTAAGRPAIAGPAGGSAYGGSLNVATPEVAHDVRRQIESPKKPPRNDNAAREPLREPAYAPAVAPGSIPAAGAAAPIDLQLLYNRFASQLLTAARLDPMSFELVAHRDLNEAAINAGKAVDSLKEAAPSLGREVARHERMIETSVQRAYEALAIEAGSDEDALNALEDAYADVRSSIAALMLAPRGPFESIVDRMIRELEQAAAPDDGHRDIDHHLLIRLRSLRASLQGLDRRSAQSWETAGNIVFRYDEQPTDIAMPRVASTGH